MELIMKSLHQDRSFDDIVKDSFHKESKPPNIFDTKELLPRVIAPKNLVEE